MRALVVFLVLILVGPLHAVGFKPPGVFQWQRGAGSTLGDGVTGAAIDASGNRIVVGDFNGTVDFGTGPLTSAGTYDAFIAKYTATGTPLWSKRLGANGVDIPRGVAVDLSGNVVVVGVVQATVDLGGGSQAGFGSDDIFIVKYSAAGAYQWSRHMGAAQGDVATGVAVDASGNVVVVGSFQGTVDFGGQSLTATGTGVNAFMAKYSSAGTLAWAKQFATAGINTGIGPNAVTVDASGNVVITGNFAGTVDFGNGTAALVTVAFDFDLFVAKFSSAGATLWAKRGGGSGAGNQDAGNAVAVTSNGDVVVTGYFDSPADFGGGALTSAGTGLVVAKYAAATGAHQWSKGYGGAGGATGTAVAFAPASNGIITVTGYFGGTTSFGGAALSSGAGSDDIFVVRYVANDGAHLWSKKFGGPDIDRGAAVANDAAGNSLITGFFQYQVYFTADPPPPLVSAGQGDAFLLSLGP